ncbi:MAG: HmuY family protein, partial [Muribaculaceae bacterium]|nr:HmuY family protein [Muribaculaceae bacterium]
GNQGILVNNVLSTWLKVNLPPIPPSFTLNNKVFIIKTPEGRFGAIQLENYQSSTGVKCCLTINYKYPL